MEVLITSAVHGCYVRMSMEEVDLLYKLVGYTGTDNTPVSLEPLRDLTNNIERLEREVYDLQNEIYKECRGGESY